MRFADARKFLNHHASRAVFALVVALLPVLGGCTIHNVRTTSVQPVGFSPSKPEQVELLKYGQPVPRPYQILGKAGVFQARSGILKSPADSEWPEADQRLRAAAAEMGADAVIWVHDGIDGRPGGNSFRSGVAVKWLPPGQTAQPPRQHFIVGFLPVSSINNAHATPKILRLIQQYAQYELEEEKGYYVLPLDAIGSPASREEFLLLSGDARQRIGGEPTQLLMELRFVDYQHTHTVVEQGSQMRLVATLFSKQTGEVLWQSDQEGGFGKSILTSGLLFIHGLTEGDVLTGAGRDAVKRTFKTMQPVGGGNR